MPKNAMRGLILRGGALGDGLLTLPVLHALRHAFPGIILEWAGNPRLAGLLLTAGLVQRHRSIEEAVMAELYVPRGSRNAVETAWIQSFDFILHFLHDPDGVVAENLNRMGARQLIQRSPLVPQGHASLMQNSRKRRPRRSVALQTPRKRPFFPDGGTRSVASTGVSQAPHASRHFLRALTELGITNPNVLGQLRGGVAAPLCRGGQTISRRQSAVATVCPIETDPLPPNVPEVWLPWPEKQKKAGRTLLKALGLKSDVVALHPGSGSPRKNWPLEKFMTLGRRLRDGGVNVLFLLGEAEASFLPSVLSAIARRATVEALAQAGPALQESGMAVLREASLETVADALSACRGYVGNDSGVTHLAAVLGLPVVAVFGRTDPAVWGPLGPKSVTIRSPEQTYRSLAAIPVEAVMKVLVSGTSHYGKAAVP